MVWYLEAQFYLASTVMMNRISFENVQGEHYLVHTHPHTHTHTHTPSVQYLSLSLILYLWRQDVLFTGMSL